MPRLKKTNGKIDWEKANDVKIRLLHLIKVLDFDHVDTDRIFCYRSYGSSSRSYARIWGLNRVWQMALDAKPGYVIEVLSEKFDPLSQDKKDEVLIHELLHIPQNFSGALLPHHRKGPRNFHDRVRRTVAEYKKFNR